MATTYDEIRDLFLSKITDYTFVKLTEVEANEILDKYLKSAITRFYNCVQDLEDRDDELRQFNITLTTQEQNILACSMGLEWLSPRVLHEQNLKNAIGSKDYSVYSTGNLLKELLNLKRELENDINNLMTLYHYTN